jgi:ketosteroid isomerase-like protein
MRFTAPALVFATTLALPVAAAAADAKAELLAAERQFAEAAAAHGAAGWLAWFAEGAAIFPADAGIVVGLSAVRAYYAKTDFSPAGLTWTPAFADVSASGELGYTYGTWHWQGLGADGGPATHSGKYVTIWRRQADGSWKVVADIGNSDRAPALP